jgi:LysR family transcriptional regulator, transcriptional activator of nhaA
MKKLKDMNWNHLYAFNEVAKVESLKLASQIMGIAPSTLSEQLKKLEEDLGLQLFQRSSKGLFLTRDGEKLFERSKEMFEVGSKLMDALSETVIGGYSVTVGIEETVCYDIATEFVSQYWDLFTPFGTVNTSRQMEHGLLVENIQHGVVDWGVTLRAPIHKSIDYEKVGDFELTFMCAEELYEKFIDPKDIIRNIPLAHSTWDDHLHHRIQNYLKDLDSTPREMMNSDHIDYIKKLCLRGRCVMYLAQNPLQEYPGLRKFQLERPLKVDLFACWKKSNQNMLSIKKLQELICSKLTHLPHRYKDLELQIEVSDVSDELLK